MIFYRVKVKYEPRCAVKAVVAIITMNLFTKSIVKIFALNCEYIRYMCLTLLFLCYCGNYGV